MLASWNELKRGAGCPLCSPRADYDEYRYLVRKLQVSTLYLTRGQRYLGTCVLVFDGRHLAYISELGDDEWVQLAVDLRESEKAIHQAFSPDHLNVECLGNTVPHLHFGLILCSANIPSSSGRAQRILVMQSPEHRFATH